MCGGSTPVDVYIFCLQMLNVVTTNTSMPCYVYLYRYEGNVAMQLINSATGSILIDLVVFYY